MCIYDRFALPYIPDEQTAQYKRRTDRRSARTRDRGHNSDRDDSTTLSNEVEVYEASKPEQGELGLPSRLKILLVDDSISILKVSNFRL